MGILLLPVYLILLPMLLGAAVAEEPKQLPLPLGMMLQMALFQLTGLPFVLLGRSMKELTMWVNIIYLSAGLFCFLFPQRLLPLGGFLRCLLCLSGAVLGFLFLFYRV